MVRDLRDRAPEDILPPFQGMCAGLGALRPRPGSRARSSCNFSGSRKRGASFTGFAVCEADRWVSAPSVKRPATIVSEPINVGCVPACGVPASGAPATWRARLALS